MKHLGFIALALLALLIVAPGALVWAMNECQLHATQAAADACFENARGSEALWPLTVAGLLLLAVALHIFGSRWKLAALAALAVGPWLVM